MKRSLLVMVLLVLGYSAFSQSKATNTDRKYWADLCYQISAPVLSNMSRGQLAKNMKMELSPYWEKRDVRVAYMEAFGRLMAGIAPWLALPDDNTAEGKQRQQLRQWALASYKNAVDPKSPDYLLWKGEAQILVDAAYLAQSFLRAPKALWEPLDNVTKRRYIENFKGLRTIRPAYNNWVLFRTMIETFLVYNGEPYDAFAVDAATHKMEEWYLSDGFYGDGSHFAMDYYNAYVMHPMYLEIQEILLPKKVINPAVCNFDRSLQRMQRYNQILERMISPEGTYPPVGRSVVYRMGAFQTLALSAWKYGMPKGLSNGQVRSALTAVMKRMFGVNGNFDKDGFLQLGFAGHQPELANSYSNNGSLYMTSLVFMPLGLPATHDFWTAPAEKWTSQKAWSGESFPMDKALH